MHQESEPQSQTVRCFQQVLELERAALDVVCERLRGQAAAIESACQMLSHEPSGAARRVIVSGVGKAGLIARKVAATLSSTGTAATFLHPVDGLHGDLGFARSNDTALLFSHSGETVEVIRMAKHLSALGCTMIAVTKSSTSSLAQIVDACLVTGEVDEACFLGLAPTSSTTIMLAIGDALALTVAQNNHFREEDFAKYHPAGSLGLRFTRAEAEMRTGERLVCVAPEMLTREVVQLVSRAKTGAAVLVNCDGTLYGIFTDGDLRRALLRNDDAMARPVGDFASHPCHFLGHDSSLAEALNHFAATRSEDLPIVDRSSGKVVGMLCLKDLSRI